ncbi:MAG: helix-turn-helix transcriptional regulator [Candidatus Omnitrophica bacterium]|nr:helix-turn-helix transcriptional regulator [Candidatus Omnitrophota bacterium]
MTRKNWHWDIRIPYSKIEQILKLENDPRFPRIAGALLSRVEDPKQVFQLISPASFCRRWRAIEREIQSDEWTREKASFWKATYLRLSKELQEKGEKIRQPEVIELDDFTREVIKKIRDCRKKALMSQGELAHFMGCSQQFISGLEKGREKVTLEFLKKLSQVTRQPIEFDILPEENKPVQQNFLRAAEEEQDSYGVKKKKKES